MWFSGTELGKGFVYKRASPALAVNTDHPISLPEPVAGAEAYESASLTSSRNIH
jgi:hypothetical protein